MVVPGPSSSLAGCLAAQLGLIWLTYQFRSGNKAGSTTSPPPLSEAADQPSCPSCPAPGYTGLEAFFIACASFFAGLGVAALLLTCLAVVAGSIGGVSAGLAGILFGKRFVKREKDAEQLGGRPGDWTPSPLPLCWDPDLA